MTKTKAGPRDRQKSVMIWIPQELKDLMAGSGLGITGFIEVAAIVEFMKRDTLDAKTVRQWISEDRLDRVVVARLQGEGLI